MRTRSWQLLDTMKHALHLPFTGWICDRFDVALFRDLPDYCSHHVTYSKTRALTCGQCGQPIPYVETSAAASWPA